MKVGNLNFWHLVTKQITLLFCDVNIHDVTNNKEFFAQWYPVKQKQLTMSLYSNADILFKYKYIRLGEMILCTHLYTIITLNVVFDHDILERFTPTLM